MDLSSSVLERRIDETKKKKTSKQKKEQKTKNEVKEFLLVFLASVTSLHQCVLIVSLP